MYKTFSEMSVWQKAHKLAVDVFQLTVGLPKSEDYGLTSQLRRSANSIAGNIAEGFGRNTNKDKSNFYIIARGSAYETQNHLLYGNKVGYFETEKMAQLIKETDIIIHDINKIINSFKQG